MKLDNTYIAEAEERAARALDGMTYNRTLMAKDVQRMAAELRNWQAAFDRMKAKAISSGSKGFGGFGDFNDVFKDIFK